MATRPQTWWWGFVTIAGIHLVALLLSVSEVSRATKPLLMPVLLVWFLAATPRSRLRTIVAVGLGFSWIGDVALMGEGETWFLAGLGGFLVAQVLYAVAFWPSRGRSVLHRPVLTTPYVAAVVALLAVLWPHLGELRIPVVLYAVAIIVMAILATGLGPTVAIGAILFVISDSLIALDAVAGLARLPQHSLWVMATYLAAQGMIARGVSRSVGRTEADETEEQQPGPGDDQPPLTPSP